MIGPDQMAMLQALMGGVAQPGVMNTGQNPTTQYGQSALTGNPTVPGGMLGTNPYQSVNPNQPALQTGQMGGMGQTSGQTGQMQTPANQQLQQMMQQYPGTGGAPMMGSINGNNPNYSGWDGGGGGAQGQ